MTWVQERWRPCPPLRGEACFEFLARNRHDLAGQHMNGCVLCCCALHNQDPSSTSPRLSSEKDTKTMMAVAQLKMRQK